MKTKISSPSFRYYGGKWRLAPWIISHFPEHCHYVELCGGAASVLLQKPLSKLETFNDLNKQVVNFFTVLRDHPDELVERIAMTPWSRVEYESAFAPTDDAIESARRWWVMHAQGIAASTEAVAWRCVTQSNQLIPEFDNRDRTIANLRAIAHRLRRVQLECRPALDIISRYDAPETLFYADPPYVGETRTETERYAHEFSDDDHRALATALCHSKGKVILSGYKSPLYEELYEAHGWSSISCRTGGNSGSQRIEVLWKNPACDDVLFPIGGDDSVIS